MNTINHSSLLLTAVVSLALVGAACASTSATKTTATTQSTAHQAKYALVIHGGAGTILRSNMSPEQQKAYEDALNQALDAGLAVLKGGGASVDAVVASIKVMEDSPLFNAGKGAVYNAEAKHELDASIMIGSTKQAGAVAGVSVVKNPIEAAKAVMERSKHVMLASTGADQFAKEKGLVLVDNSYFDTERRLKSLKKAQAKEKQVSYEPPARAYFGTVGAVALDQHGVISAGTSTGGMTNKRWGRVGDSPIIGAGTYANAECGVSATGWGEYFIRLNVAHDICARTSYRGDSLPKAAHDVVMNDVPTLGGDGGVIALDASGQVALPFNTEGMYRAWRDGQGKRGVAIFGNKQPVHAENRPDH